MPRPGDIDQSYPSFLEKNNKIVLLEPFSGAKKHHKMKCLVCDNIWSATPISKRQAFKKYGVGGCPRCNDQRKTDRYRVIQQKHIDNLQRSGLVLITDSFTSLRSSTSKIRFKNINCGHEFESSPGNIINLGTTCVVCGIQERTSNINAWSKANSEQWKATATGWQLYKAQVSKLTRQTYSQNKKIINPKKLKRGKAGVEGAHHLDHIVPIRFCFENNIPPEVCASADNLQMLHWNDNVGSRSTIKGTIPPLFFKYVEPPTRITNYITKLKNIFPDAETHVPVGGTVATLFDAKTNHAIVIVSLDQQYANQKIAIRALKEFQKVGCSYTILFEDELANWDIVRSKIQHQQQSNNQPRVHARQCDIRLVDRDQKSIFLSKYHIQGNDNSQIAYGAFLGDTLVAIMTFSRPRVALGQKAKTPRIGVWELARFTTHREYRVPGVASKLLTHFKRNHDWREIYSYADRRWGDGNLYNKLGFELTATNQPDYFYVVDGKRKHRWNFRKDILKNKLPNFDPNLTEYQNMVNHGFWRVWDCGTLKFSIHR